MSADGTWNTTMNTPMGAQQGTLTITTSGGTLTGKLKGAQGELEAEGVALVNENVSRMATLSADEASHWDRLHDGWQVGRINHSEAYSTPESCTNQVESYFSRLRRMVSGQHHHVSPRYLHQYAAQAAWMEDHRRMPNGELVHAVLALAMAHPVSRAWKGYWQRQT